MRGIASIIRKEVGLHPIFGSAITYHRIQVFTENYVGAIAVWFSREVENYVD